MKEIDTLILKYLNKHYRFSLSTYTSYKLVDMRENKVVSMNETLADLTVIFGISQAELTPIFDQWATRKALDLNNRIVDIRTQLYIKTGFELKLTVGDINMIVEEMSEDIGINFAPYIARE